jgi:hypothetical protein
MCKMRCAKPSSLQARPGPRVPRPRRPELAASLYHGRHGRPGEGAVANGYGNGTATAAQEAVARRRETVTFRLQLAVAILSIVSLLLGIFTALAYSGKNDLQNRVDGVSASASASIEALQAEVGRLSAANASVASQLSLANQSLVAAESSLARNSHSVGPSPSPSAPRREFTLPLSTICNLPTVEQSFCSDGTVRISGGVFSYAIGDVNIGIQPPRWTTVLEVKSSSCSSITLKFVEDIDSGAPGASAYIHVLQDSGPAQTSPGALVGHVGALTATLNGGPFFVETNSTDGADVWVNGNATCATESGT